MKRAFPSWMTEDTRACESIVPPDEQEPPPEAEASETEFAVRVGGEQLLIPYRIYQPEPEREALAGLSSRQRVITACLYTRHHDGRVRQRNLERIITETSPWTVPYVVRLAGEYVIEISRVIDATLSGLIEPGSPAFRAYGRFAIENPEFIARTRAQAASYWGAYHRGQVAAVTDHPGYRFLTLVAEAGRDYVRSSASGGRG
jgi:hypothetical protein